MIRVQGVGLHYTGRDGSGPEVLRDLSCTIPAGGFRWLLGPSGAGKSSLLRLLHVAVRPTRGALNLLGTDIGQSEACRDFAGSAAAHRHGVPRFPAAGAHLSVFDNVALPLRLAGRAEGQQSALDVTEMLRWSRAGDEDWGATLGIVGR